MAELTAEVVRELLDYDPETGALTWRPRDRRWFKRERDYKMWNTRFAGRPAGYHVTHTNGYIEHRVNLLGRFYYAGRLAWLHRTGDWPRGTIDHIDRDPLNQRLSNLRDVTTAENLRNKSVYARRKGRGYPGVYFDCRYGTWRALIGYSGKWVSLGTHKTLLDAVAARKRAEREYGFSPGHGRPRPEGRKNHG